MDLKITGNPGTGNTFQEVHIGTVQNYNPNATTVINHNYGERHKAPAAVTPALPEADLTPLRDEVLHYVMKIQGCVSPQWAERYSTLWHQVLAAPEVEAVIYKPGKQQNTTFNRTLVANIIYRVSCRMSRPHAWQNCSRVTKTIPCAAGCMTTPMTAAYATA